MPSLNLTEVGRTSQLFTDSMLLNRNCGPGAIELLGGFKFRFSESTSKGSIRQKDLTKHSIKLI